MDVLRFTPQYHLFSDTDLDALRWPHGVAPPAQLPREPSRAEPSRAEPSRAEPSRGRGSGADITQRGAVHRELDCEM